MLAARAFGWIPLVAVALALTGSGQQPPKEPRPAKVRLDLSGDPLPEGAIARLGTLRFRHPGAVHAVAFSPDGKLLAASSDGETRIIIWDRTTGRKVHEIPVNGRGPPPKHLRFSPDNKRLYASFWYGPNVALYAWDVETGADAKDLPRLPAEARILAYSPDGREMILLQKEADLVRWDVEKGKERGRYPKPSGTFSTAARVGDRLLVPRFNGQSVGMWDAGEKKEIWSAQTTRQKEYPFLTMAFAPDGKHFAVEAPSRVIAVYESVSGKRVRQFKGDVGRNYSSLAISPDGRTVAGSNWDGTVRLWDMESGRERAKIPRIDGWVTNIFFAPDSKTFATGGGNNAHALLLWDTATGKRIEPFAGHANPVSWAAFSPDGRTAATASWLGGDPVVRLWDPATGRPLRAFGGSQGGVAAVVHSPDGRKLAACGWSDGKQIRIWDSRTGHELHALAGHEMGCTCLAFSPDGTRLASGDAYSDRTGKSAGRLCIWDAGAGKRLREIRGTPGAIRRVLFTPDGRHVLAAADGVHIYDAETGERIGEPLQPNTRVGGLALSEDGRLMATADGRGAVRLWELASRREISLKVPGRGYAVGLSPDGRTLVTCGPDGSLLMLHWPSGETVGRLTPGETNVTQVFLSPDGRRLATASNQESSALVWDVAKYVNLPLPEVHRPADADLRRWWADLREGDPGKAYRAVWRFAAAPEAALPFLAASLRPVEAPEPKAVARLIADLDSPQFQAREKASRELERFGESVLGALRKAKQANPSAEQGQRIDRLLAKLSGPVPGPEQLRVIRAVAALEQIGGPEARKLLTKLAAGAEGARLTREATGALGRLERNER